MVKFKEAFLESVLRDLDFPITNSGKFLIDVILCDSKQDMVYVWSKVPALIDKITKLNQIKQLMHNWFLHFLLIKSFDKTLIYGSYAFGIVILTDIISNIL